MIPYDKIQFSAVNSHVTVVKFFQERTGKRRLEKGDSGVGQVVKNKGDVFRLRNNS